MVVVASVWRSAECRSVRPLWQVTAAAGPRSDFATGGAVRRNRATGLDLLVRRPCPRALLETVSMKITRDQVLAFRVHAQQLDVTTRTTTADLAVLDLGVQETGPDGGRWALELRGCTPEPDDLFTAWTLRGAPHVYRRDQAAAVAAAVAPFSEADASKRVFDASSPPEQGRHPGPRRARPDRRTRCATSRTKPVVKGAMSTELHRRLPEPYQRWCGVCDAEHLYEQPFRLAALQGGLELQPGTSPPGPPADQRAGEVRRRGSTRRSTPCAGCCTCSGRSRRSRSSATSTRTVKDVKARWPEDVVPVEVDGEERSVLEDDLDALTSPPDVSGAGALLGPFDLFLQARDRELVVPEKADRKDLWRTIGRPGGVLVGHDVLGTWRPRASGQEAPDRRQRLGSPPGPDRAGRAAGRVPRRDLRRVRRELTALLDQAYGAGSSRVGPSRR